MTYIKLFVDYLDAIEPLVDAERGRLFTALLEYARTGEAPHLSGNERFLFPMMRAQIDRDEAAMTEISEARSAAGRKGAEARVSKSKQNKHLPDLPSKSSQDKDKDKDKDKDNNTPLPPAVPETGFGADLQCALDDWLAYKREKRQGYKPTGLKSLVTQIQRHAQTHGEAAVAALIRECMACNWQGIIWDRLKNIEGAGCGYVYDYGNTEGSL